MVAVSEHFKTTVIDMSLMCEARTKTYEVASICLVWRPYITSLEPDVHIYSFMPSS
jgi:hypothetical protein